MFSLCISTLRCLFLFKVTIKKRNLLISKKILHVCILFQTSTLEEEAYPALDQLSAKTSTNNLKHVRVIKGRLVALNGRVQKV